jgi:hypothetical protein
MFKNFKKNCFEKINQVLKMLLEPGCKSFPPLYFSFHPISISFDLWKNSSSLLSVQFSPNHSHATSSSIFLVVLLGESTQGV